MKDTNLVTLLALIGALIGLIIIYLRYIGG